jgi:tryptophan 2,3-dioxygenase
MDLHRTPPDRVAALHAIRDRHAGQVAATQCARLLEAMQSLGSVTTVEASRYLDVYRPPARKWNLVEAGHTILMTWDRDVTESGAVHRVGRYSIVKGAKKHSDATGADD